MLQTTKQTANFLPHDQQTIVALCTPRGSGAIALIRLCGKDVFTVTNSLAKLAGQRALADVPTHTIHYGSIIDTKENVVIDHVLFLAMRSPQTFTGQDTIEITCHNNPFIIDRIISLALQHGARGAERGEFTRRAFLSGKVDLVQAEAINELIHAQTEHALKRSLQMLDGSFSSYVQNIEKQLTLLLGYVEASFEFLEEEQRDLAFDDTVRQRLQELQAHIAEAQKQFINQKQLREGVRITLCGNVNVGKSTLFNVLLGKERAIVTDIAGTTRDSIEATLYRNGVFLTFIDTAGVRTSHDIIEQKGIEKTSYEVASADVVLLVLDAHEPIHNHLASFIQSLIAEHKEKVIIVINKTETESALKNSTQELFAGLEKIKVSGIQQLGIQELLQAIDNRIATIFAQCNAPFLLNQRHALLLTEIDNGLQFVANSCRNSINYELVAYHLRQLLENLAQMTGRGVSERVLDTVFSEFCIGK